MTDHEKFRQKQIDKLQPKVDEYDKQLDDPKLSDRRRAKLEEKKQKIVDKIEMHERIKIDPSYADELQRQYTENSIFTKAGKKMERTGAAFDKAGRGMVKAGLHTTGAVWTPVIYAGYQGIKHARKKPKNETPEQDLIELIKEVEKAQKDGKIDEAQKREYILDFVDNYYRE